MKGKKSRHPMNEESFPGLSNTRTLNNKVIQTIKDTKCLSLYS